MSTRARRCTVYKDFCDEHDWVHGAEAEELRTGIEKLITGLQGFADEEDSVSALQELPDRLVDDLQKLLDRVDARDSLAFLDAEKRAARPRKRIPTPATYEIPNVGIRPTRRRAGKGKR
jgi:hypothetical protein